MSLKKDLIAFWLVTLVMVCGHLSWRQVEAECIQLLPVYYNCKYAPVNASTNETFLQSEFKNATTFELAMDKFKAIYDELNFNDCSSPLCKCVTANPVIAYYWQKNFYWKFFTDAQLFTDMVSMLSTLKEKYEPNLENSFYYQEGGRIVQFCFKYEFAGNMMINNAETKKCADLMAYDQNKCTSSELDQLSSLMDLSGQSAAHLENFTKCLLAPTVTCDRVIRRVLAFHYLSFYPQIINGPSLIQYIDSILDASSPQQERQQPQHTA
jgi:hypothetical protein